MLFDHLNKLSANLISSAQKGSLSQSILLIGPEGIGKFALIMELTKALLCENDHSACGNCQSCKDVIRFYHPDFLFAFPFPNIRPESKKVTIFSFSDPVSSNARYSEDTRDEVELFKKSKLENPYAILDFEKKENIPVEVIKDLIHALTRRPFRGGRRVVAILDIDKMAFGAADLFLKTVEEPPENTHLLLTTSRPDLLFPTLLSRTHRITVPPVPQDILVKSLIEKLGVQDDYASYLARASGGSLGMSVRLHESDIKDRRDKIVGFFARLLSGAPMNALIYDINNAYTGNLKAGIKIGFDEIKMDFEIIESIIHDIYLIGENGLENHLINTDIAGNLKRLNRPEREVLDIWSSCNAETSRACLVNNVAANSAMVFLYLSFAQAMRDLTMPKYKLP